MTPLLCLYWSGQQQATEVFASQTPEIEREITRLQSIRIDRPSLWGRSVPANGWDSYTQAFAAFAALPPSVHDWGGFPKPKEPLRPFGEAQRLLLAIRPVLELLKNAQQADRLEIHRRYRYYRQWEMEASYDQQGVFFRCLFKLAQSLHSAQEDEQALEILMLLLGTSVDLRHGRSLMYSRYCEYEGQAIGAFKLLLSSNSLAAGDLRNLAVFVDRTIASRSTVRDHLFAEDTSLRMATLESERNGRDFFVWEQEVSWNHLWSARLARAAALVQLKKAFSALAQVETRPVAEWEQASRGIAKDPSFKLVAVTLDDAVEEYANETKRRLGFRLLRTAVAIASYQADTGRPPESLTDLVPKYLPSMLPDDQNGQTLKYEAGKLWTAGTEKYPWTIGRTR